MNELEQVKTIHIWESAFLIYPWSESVEEVAGNPIDVVSIGVQINQTETTPKPKCKHIGYTVWEWLNHWRKLLSDTIIKSTIDEEISEYKHMIDLRPIKK